MSTDILEAVSEFNDAIDRSSHELSRSIQRGLWTATMKTQDERPGSPLGLNRVGIMPRTPTPLSSERPCEICEKPTRYRRTRCRGCGRLMGLCCYGRLGSGKEGPHCVECP